MRRLSLENVWWCCSLFICICQLLAIEPFRKMFLHCIRRRLQLLGEKRPWYQRNLSKYNTRDDGCDKTSLLMQLCADRYYISPEAPHNRTCTYGPLGTELKKNIIEQWTSAIRARANVFGITSSVQSRVCEETVRIVNVSALQEILNQDSLTKKEGYQKIQTLIKDSVSFRTSLLQGECRPFSTILCIYSYNTHVVAQSSMRRLWSSENFFSLSIKVLCSSTFRRWSLWIRHCPLDWQR